MGHYCRICGRVRANERFSGKGHARHICKDCQRLPRAEVFRIDALNEIHGYLSRQSVLSRKNLDRLAQLAGCEDPSVRELAAVVLEIGKAHPGRRRRFSSIRCNQPELWQRMLLVGIVEDLAEETTASDPVALFEGGCDDGPESGTSPAEDDIPF